MSEQKAVFPAHIRKKQDGTRVIQTVSEHCRNTATYASEKTKIIGLGSTAYLAGLLHDLGKEKKEFREYIEHAVETKERGAKIVNHSFAGVKFILDSYHNNDPISNFTSELIAYAIGAHHGLFDVANADKNGFSYRRQKEDIGYEEAIRNFLDDCADQSEVDRLFSEGLKEVQVWCDKMDTIAEKNGEFEFFAGLTAKLLLSSVIDGDRTDTAEFMNCISKPKIDTPGELWDKALKNMENMLNCFSDESEIARARRWISDRCREFAEEKTGIYRLSVPTGAGKTLSSLRFALAHAKVNKKARIIFTAPLISILDQNAEIIKAYIGNDDVVLVHHSNIVEEDPTTEKNEIPDRLSESELLKENWSAPVIITTLVQLLNTLFSGKTSSIRRMSALYDSVIIMDEVQTVPMKLMTMFNLAVRFLSSMCGVTFVMCSATQPYLEGAEHPILHYQEGCIKEIVPFDEIIWGSFKRTELKTTEIMTEERFVDFIARVLKENESLLVICNTKKEAQALYRDLCTDIKIQCFQLSAAMCMAHRRNTLDSIKDAMKNEKNSRKVVCISTQVIEAGVDISFSCVIRIAAGMDSVVQAAGRCNRNGEYETVMPVYIARLAGERLGNLKEIRDAQTATISLIEDYYGDTTKYGNDLSSTEAIQSYYKRLYRNHRKGYQDYSIEDGNTLYSLLSDNLKYYTNQNARLEDSGYIMGQAFKLAGDNYCVFDEDTTDVIVPYKDGKDIICSLQSSQTKNDLGIVVDLLRRAKPYTISIYSGQKERLLQQGYMYPIMDGKAFALADGCYNEHMGLATGLEKSDYLEVG